MGDNDAEVTTISPELAFKYADSTIYSTQNYEPDMISAILPLDPTDIPFRYVQPDTPERRLLTAILLDAVHIYMTKKEDSIQWKEGRDWLLGNVDNDTIFSFENVCLYLDVNQQYVLRRIMEERER